MDTRSARTRGKKKSFSSLSRGLKVLTACCQHITHCVIGQKSGNVVPNTQSNTRFGRTAGSEEVGVRHIRTCIGVLKIQKQTGQLILTPHLPPPSGAQRATVTVGLRRQDDHDRSALWPILREMVKNPTCTHCTSNSILRGVTDLSARQKQIGCHHH